LQLSADEWEALSWWERKAYTDGFEAEKLIEVPQEMPTTEEGILESLGPDAPYARQAEAGQPLFDIKAMNEELARSRGGGGK
jgi:hypothetical protein